VEVFKQQIASLKALLMSCPPSQSQARDMDFLLSGGELFTLVAYGQLILESAKIQGVEESLVDQIFDFMVRDFSRHALGLYSTSSTTPEQAEHCLKMIRRPVKDDDRFDSVWRDHVMAAVDAYSMNP
jgi:acyl-CoA dehydrogenase